MKPARSALAYVLCAGFLAAAVAFAPAAFAQDAAAPTDDSGAKEADAGKTDEATTTPNKEDDPSAEPSKTEPDMAFGAFQRGHYLTAMDLALPRAQLGDPVAQTLIAEIFARGLGVPRDMDNAAFWYGQAAQGGDPSGQFKYAVMLLEGRYVAKDVERAQKLMKEAADNGVAAAQFNWGQMLVSKQPGDNGIIAALPYFEKAAEAGIADAQYALSQIYANSISVTEEQRAAARKWLERAARAGYDTAELDLGMWLVDGVAGDKDYEQGFQWIRRAALGGNVMAQNRLAHLYVNAIGTRPDPIEAAKWYVLSRRAGMDDYDLDDFYQGLTVEEQKDAISRANDFRRR